VTIRARQTLAGDPAEAASIWRVTTDQKQEEVQELPMENFLLPIAAVHMNSSVLNQTKAFDLLVPTSPMSGFLQNVTVPTQIGLTSYI
jgi:hypothetical protein